MTDARDLYATRRERYAEERDVLTQRWNRLANLRLVAFVGFAGCVVWAIWVGSWWPVGPGAIGLAAFVGLVVMHRRVGRERRRAAILHDLNDEGEKRVRRDWGGLPLRHEFRAAADHPFAGDLDLFGRASGFHLLETVETPMGEAALRGALRSPVGPVDVRERQGAGGGLASLLDWRQELALRGRWSGEERPDPTPFLEWAEGEPWLA